VKFKNFVCFFKICSLLVVTPFLESDFKNFIVKLENFLRRKFCCLHNYITVLWINIGGQLVNEITTEKLHNLFSAMIFFDYYLSRKQLGQECVAHRCERVILSDQRFDL